MDRSRKAGVLEDARAAALIGRTTQATNEAFKALRAAGVITQVNLGRHRNRAFEATAIVDAFTTFERCLTTPGR